MKKIYKTPIVTVMKLQTIQMVATSIDMYGQNATGAGMSRQERGSIWDDEEDEEFY